MKIQWELKAFTKTVSYEKSKQNGLTSRGKLQIQEPKLKDEPSLAKEITGQNCFSFTLPKQHFHVFLCYLTTNSEALPG